MYTSIFKQKKKQSSKIIELTDGLFGQGDALFKRRAIK